MKLAKTVAAVLAFYALPAHSEMWIRADLPLDMKEFPKHWPRNCEPEPGMLAECSNFAMGNWSVDYLGCKDRCHRSMFLEAGGLRYAFAEGEDRFRAEPDGTPPTYIIPLSPDGAHPSLFAFEIGSHDGSRYILVSSEEVFGKTIEKASILDVRCPTQLKGVPHRSASLREVETDYCSISSEEALLFMANDALKRPPLARMEWTGPVHE